MSRAAANQTIFSNIIRPFWIAAFLCVALLAGICWYVLAPPKQFPREMVLTIDRGENLYQLSLELRKAKVIRFGKPFETIAAALGARGRSIAGSYRFVQPENAASLAWRITHADYQLEKAKTKSSSAPRAGGRKIWNFVPDHFQRMFGDSIAPVLHIAPGDSVRTWTLDSSGLDRSGVRRSLGGNPQTGPFYVNGAAPGDTLRIKLNQLQLNRNTALSGRSIPRPFLLPEYVRTAKLNQDFDSMWTLDLARGLARLSHPSDGLKHYTVPLRPVLGCIAVAPPGHKSVGTTNQGSYGGNLDYNRIREGATIYLPVSVAGALLFVGDGHAAQGDGELSGDALETSLNLEFTVDVIKGFATAYPRVENDDSLMASGIGKSLNEAFQIATTQMALWLERDYQLGPNEAAMVLASAAQYDIAEAVDPQLHVVARIRRDLLAHLR